MSQNMKGLTQCEKARAPEEGPGEATGESLAQLQQETLAFWRCQYHGTTVKNSTSCGVEPA